MPLMRNVLAGLVAVVVLAGCLMIPHPRGGGVVLAPPLPPIVVLGAEPYYAQNGYHYHYRNDGWSYSRSKRGPWVDLPRDRYPREVRYKDDGPKRGGGGKKDGGGKSDGDSRKDGGRDAGRRGK